MSLIPNTICLFDVDGTLTKPRNSITPEFKQFLSNLRTKVELGVVGGSDLIKIKEQLGEGCVNDFHYVFAENGLLAFKDGSLLATQSIKKFLGEDKIKQFVNFVLHYIADLDIPIKRGTFVEFRNGMINISPIGRNCSQEERDDFEKFDLKNKIRETMVSVLKEKFADFGLQYSIGGQISFDVFPVGWDKTYCLGHLPEEKYKTIYFFGDKTFKGGNDYEIANDKRITKSFTVTSPVDTQNFLNELFYKN
ncbi:phosphomannomutase [Dictyostelium purpureum]|uniref:Phosphomannomutase n=1 Tax=Dictyostelium purpureum TaxID=5786 RepID=F0Z904_DICPU|nr:phosphomannomutase [Dictyostelium purpureum]EGC39553.1 phosphomannomutase [Dictyostelium purpureum]|eukprot:XP_003283888.1 phosphomannomutase [Dictyostelium purpureum]